MDIDLISWKHYSKEILPGRGKWKSSIKQLNTCMYLCFPFNTAMVHVYPCRLIVTWDFDGIAFYVFIWFSYMDDLSRNKKPHLFSEQTKLQWLTCCLWHPGWDQLTLWQLPLVVRWSIHGHTWRSGMGNHGFLPSPRMTQSALDSRMEFSSPVHPELISTEVLLCTFVL